MPQGPSMPEVDEELDALLDADEAVLEALVEELEAPPALSPPVEAVVVAMPPAPPSGGDVVDEDDALPPLPGPYENVGYPQPAAIEMQSAPIAVRRCIVILGKARAKRGQDTSTARRVFRVSDSLARR